MRFITSILAAGLLSATISCKKQDDKADASGTFEAEETVISAEVSGLIRQFDIEEGQALQTGQVIGYIDSVQLYLKKKQLEAQAGAVLGRRPDVEVQLAALQEQLKAAEREQQRIGNLVKADAATGKQLDDINAQVAVVKRQIAAQRSSLDISSSGISKDATPLQVQAQQVEDQLRKCVLINTMAGTVLTKYTEVNEMAVAGKPLYRIADLSSMTLRVYLTGAQLPQVKLNQKVKVLTDDGKGGYREAEGQLIWISNKAEFTPKTIQTKDERANLVYAAKVKVKNDGTYKIGMYGAIQFQ